MKAPQRCQSYTGNKGGECSPAERLAHCLRVDWTCPYCGCDLREAAVVSMDHVLAQVYGGTKSEKNIIACCGSCNSSKKHKLLADFAAGRGDMAIVKRVKQALNRRLPLSKAKKIMQGENSQQAKSTKKRATTVARKSAKTASKKPQASTTPETIQLPRNDTEILDQLVEGLDELVGVYDKIHEALSSDKAHKEFVGDFEIEPVEALENANDNLTMKVIQVRAQRALIADTAGNSTDSGDSVVH